MGDKLNHRRKNKEVRKYEELDISKFDDIIKKPQKPKQDKSNKKPYKKKYDNKNKSNNNEKKEELKENKDKKPNKSKKNHKPKDKGNSKWVPFFFGVYLPELPKAPVPRSDGICCRFSYGISSIANLGTGTTNAWAIPFSYGYKIAWECS